MNKRVLLYGIVGAFLLYMFLGDDAPKGAGALALDLRQQSAFKNECRKEIVGFEQPARSKSSFCDCVADAFETKLTNDEETKKNYAAFVAQYSQLTDSPRSISRSLSSNSVESFTSGDEKVDILLSSLDLRYRFKEMADLSTVLTKNVATQWKSALVTCSHIDAPIGRVSQ
ncbi:MAG: hypothetical protein ABIR96_03360 [Bdellovibrionota bacterium]